MDLGKTSWTLSKPAGLRETQLGILRKPAGLRENQLDIEKTSWTWGKKLEIKNQADSLHKLTICIKKKTKPD
jgi:hypothetical protein